MASPIITVPTGSPVYPAGTEDDLASKLAAGDREGVVETFFRRVLGMNDASEVVGYFTLHGEQARVHGFVARMRR